MPSFPVLISAFVVAMSLGSCKVRRYNARPRAKGESGAALKFTPFDVNDVSFLFPLMPNSLRHVCLPDHVCDEPGSQPPEHGLLFPLFEKHAEGIKALPPILFRKLTECATTGTLGWRADARRIFDSVMGDKNLRLWKITALRFEPCFSAKDFKNCSPELRLVAQPFRTNPSSNILTLQERNPRHPRNFTSPLYAEKGTNLELARYAPEDYALHLTYRIEVEDVPALVRKLAQIKLELKNASIETSGVPLWVHPELYRDHETKTGTRRILRDLIRTHCSPAALFNAEIFLTSGTTLEREKSHDVMWEFKELHCKHSDDLEASDFVADPGRHGVQGVAWRDGYLRHPKDKETGKTFYEIVKAWRAANRDKGDGNENQPLLPHKDRILDIAVTLDHPGKTMTRGSGADCTSCHFSSTLRYLSRSLDSNDRLYNVRRKRARNDFNINNIDLMGNYLESLDLKFADDEGRPTKFAYTLEPDDPIEPYPFAEYNLHAFSYFFYFPSVSSRVIAESARAAHHINVRYGGILEEIETH